MIYNWLKHDDNAENVIVFFNGWGFDERVVKHLVINEDTNVLIISDYSNLNFELPDLSRYQHRSLIAWSFGVANYSAWQQNHLDIFDSKIAINGTTQGVNRQLGIAKKVVQHTIDTLCRDSFKEFICRCYNHNYPLDIVHLVDNVTDTELNTKKTELQLINERDYSNTANLTWDNVWISQQDNIFPSKNQKNAWHDKPITLIGSTHAPFGQWLNWQDLLANS